MGITNSNKELSKSSISCNEKFNVQLSLLAEPNIVTNPVDIVLVLDNSYSMTGAPLSNLKAGAKQFIKTIDAATGGEDGTIGDGSKIGIVTFNDTAVRRVQLSTDVSVLNSAIGSMRADGLTNHYDAFEKAISMFDDASTNEKVIVMFTDGKTTVGPDANTAATQAKAKGIIIYCLGLENAALDVDALKLWASDPNSAYLSLAPTPDDIETLFVNLVENINSPGATNIVLKDTINPCFKVTRIFTPSKGNGAIIDENNVEWTIDSLGTNTSEGATFEFEVEHIGPCEGLIEVNSAVDYKDSEQNIVSFPSPKINVNCSTEVISEDCPVPVDVNIDSCEDFVDVDAGSMKLDSLGRIVQLNVKLNNVCPNRRVALAVAMTEVDSTGTEHDRGVKMMTIPAHEDLTCKDVLVRCIKFVLPENIEGTQEVTSLCTPRQFKARFIANYIDSNVSFDCCNPTV